MDQVKKQSLGFTSSAKTPGSKRSTNLFSIPPEVWPEITPYLSTEDLKSLSLVSKTYLQCASSALFSRTKLDADSLDAFENGELVDLKAYVRHVTLEGLTYFTAPEAEQAVWMVLDSIPFLPMFPKLNSLEIPCQWVGARFFYAITCRVLEYFSQLPLSQNLRVLKLRHERGNIYPLSIAMNEAFTGNITDTLKSLGFSSLWFETKSTLKEYNFLPNLTELIVEDIWAIDIMSYTHEWTYDVFSLLGCSLGNLRKLSVSCGCLAISKPSWPEGYSADSPEGWTEYHRLFPKTYALVEELSITLNGIFRWEDFDLLHIIFPSLRVLTVNAQSFWNEPHSDAWCWSAWVSLMCFNKLETASLVSPLPIEGVEVRLGPMNRRCGLKGGYGEVSFRGMMKPKDQLEACTLANFFSVIPAERLNYTAFEVTRKEDKLGLRAKWYRQ
ncbi:hypothetical protein TWF506_009153 [Arthrobotrys conoides]|uniref:F-box domain-containing protein n=1 Tax=Arthrobotrys conoides TaxID=74498 RepID=A0AAN8N489_9PEZI